MGKKKNSKPNPLNSGLNVDAQKAIAVERIRGLFTEIARPVEPLLEQFARLGLEYGVVQAGETVSFTSDTLVIRMQDLNAAEERNQEQGSILKRVYDSQR